VDVMSDAPARVSEEQLDELHLKLEGEALSELELKPGH